MTKIRQIFLINKINGKYFIALTLFYVPSEEQVNDFLCSHVAFLTLVLHLVIRQSERVARIFQCLECHAVSDNRCMPYRALSLYSPYLGGRDDVVKPPLQ